MENFFDFRPALSDLRAAAGPHATVVAEESFAVGDGVCVKCQSFVLLVNGVRYPVLLLMDAQWVRREDHVSVLADFFEVPDKSTVIR
jgi:hypothetical protein